MATNQTKFLIILAAAGAGVYFLMPKKAKAAIATTPKPTPLPKPEEKPIELPGVDEPDYGDLPKYEEPSEELPTLEDEYGDLPKPPDLDEETIYEEDIQKLPKTEDAPQQGQIKFVPVMDDFYQKWLITGDDVPSQADPHKLWISESCQSWGVGKNWAPYLMAKYILNDNALEKYKLDPDQMILPTDYWDLIGGSISPDPIYVNNLYGDIPRYQWTRNLLKLYAPQCADVIPDRKTYGDTGFKQYKEALTSFSKTKFGQLFKFLSEDIGQKMYDHWSEKYPVQADIENRKGWALWAVREYPKYSTTEQTDQAYKKYFQDDPNAPKKIDPKLAAHKPFQKAWIDLNQWVKSYRDLIAKWG